MWELNEIENNEAKELSEFVANYIVTQIKQLLSDLIKWDMIEELKEHIYGYSPEGKPELVGPPTPEELMDKINEIIRYINSRERP